MLVFSDPALIEAVVAATRRGVSVRVMLNPARRSGERDNGTTRRTLEGARVDVKDANPVFDLTHEKSMVVDSRTEWRVPRRLPPSSAGLWARTALRVVSTSL
jgi:phosphatidylserine/phosphatidylglycerophosphate/cardiolipin synthase-like enzyme